MYIPCAGKSTLTTGYKYGVIPMGFQYYPLLALFSKRCRLVAIAICNVVKLIIFCASTVANEEHFAQGISFILMCRIANSTGRSCNSSINFLYFSVHNF